MHSLRMTIAWLLSLCSIAFATADEINHRDDDTPKTSAAIRELVRCGAVVKRFVVIESETAGLLVRLRAEHLDQFGQVRNEILVALSSLNDLALELRGLPFSDVGLKSILTKLKLIGLDVSGSKVSDRGLLDLPSQRNSLRMLDLSFTRVGDAGLKPVASLEELRHLSLIDCPVSDDGAELLACLSRAREIYVSKTSVSEKAIERLKRSLPTCRIER